MKITMELPGLYQKLPYAAAQGETRDRQQQPEKAEQRADLSHDVQRPVGIVPDVPAQYYVNQKSGAEFHGGYGRRRYKALCPQGESRGAYDIHEGEAGSPAQQHRPVGPAPPDYLDKTVKARAENIDKQCFHDQYSFPKISKKPLTRRETAGIFI